MFHRDTVFELRHIGNDTLEVYTRNGDKETLTLIMEFLRNSHKLAVYLKWIENDLLRRKEN